MNAATASAGAELAVENRRVLVVDDTPSIHEDFRRILARRPPGADLWEDERALFGDDVAAPPPATLFEVHSAFQGAEGLEKVLAATHDGRPYAVAIVDMRMPPGWDGVETIERLWRVDPHLQVVMCTAYSGIPWSDVLIRLDARDRLVILRKPFDAAEVVQLANALAAKWEAARQSRG